MFHLVVAATYAGHTRVKTGPLPSRLHSHTFSLAVQSIKFNMALLWSLMNDPRPRFSTIMATLRVPLTFTVGLGMIEVGAIVGTFMFGIVRLPRRA